MTNDPYRGAINKAYREAILLDFSCNHIEKLGKGKYVLIDNRIGWKVAFNNAREDDASQRTMQKQKTKAKLSHHNQNIDRDHQ